LFHLQLYLNCIFTYVLISFSHGYSATLAAKLIIKLDLIFPNKCELERFQIDKMTSEVTQGHRIVAT